MTVAHMTEDERMVFAGCLRRLVQAEGTVTDGEIAGIEELRDRFEFSDLDERLDDFAVAIEARGGARAEDNSAFDAVAGSVVRPEVRSFIVQRLEQVSLMDGYRDASEVEFLNHLKALWAS